ncbi:hypothetical protein AMECASPLE_029081 [Ameca splendens]|uniref:Uncharacterized protein n=1 Tax=Ameca splendens TaxID=208324 RepID=A0ABV0Y5G2_9TELE
MHLETVSLCSQHTDNPQSYKSLFLARVNLGERGEVGFEAMSLFGLFRQSFKVSQVVRNKKDQGGSSRLMLPHHRCFRSALYMAKPNTANTVAPRLALSQKVEFFRSAWAMCL